MPAAPLSKTGDQQVTNMGTPVFWLQKELHIHKGMNGPD